jgi:hypothetical protein
MLAAAKCFFAKLPWRGLDASVLRVDVRDKEPMVCGRRSHGPHQPSVGNRCVAAAADVAAYIYVVDEQGKLLGALDLQDMLKAEPGDTLADLMTTNFVTLQVDDTVKEAAKSFDPLNKDAPAPRAVQAARRTLPTPILGGLHHQYVHIRSWAMPEAMPVVSPQ